MAGGPADFEEGDFVGLAQAEVDAQIVLGEVAAATADFVDLLVRLGFVGRVGDAAESGAYSAAVRFGADGADF